MEFVSTYDDAVGAPCWGSSGLTLDDCLESCSNHECCRYAVFNAFHQFLNSSQCAHYSESVEDIRNSGNLIFLVYRKAQQRLGKTIIEVFAI